MKKPKRQSKRGPRQARSRKAKNSEVKRVFCAADGCTGHGETEPWPFAVDHKLTSLEKRLARVEFGVGGLALMLMLAKALFPKPDSLPSKSSIDAPAPARTVNAPLTRRKAK